MCKKKKVVQQPETPIFELKKAEPYILESGERDYFAEYYNGYKNDYINQYLEAYKSYKEGKSSENPLK